MTNVFLKPACDEVGAPLLVRDPVTMRPLAVDGEWKTKTDYWIRRERDKEVIDATLSSAAIIAASPGGVAGDYVQPSEPSPASSLLNLIKPSA